MAKSLALAACTVIACSGCGGLAATQSVSPLMFLLPGLAEAKPAPAPLVPLNREAASLRTAAVQDSAAAD